jgi:hypothetical protein
VRTCDSGAASTYRISRRKASSAVAAAQQHTVIQRRGCRCCNLIAKNQLHLQTERMMLQAVASPRCWLTRFQLPSCQTVDMRHFSTATAHHSPQPQPKASSFFMNVHARPPPPNKLAFRLHHHISVLNPLRRRLSLCVCCCAAQRSPSVQPCKPVPTAVYGVSTASSTCTTARATLAGRPRCAAASAAGGCGGCAREHRVVPTNTRCIFLDCLVAGQGGLKWKRATVYDCALCRSGRPNHAHQAQSALVLRHS